MLNRSVAEQRGRTGRNGLLIHCGLLALAPFVALAPPARGTMLVVPLGAASVDAALAWTSQADARVIAPGPIPGSLLVEGSLARLWAPALGHGALLMRAEFLGCGVAAEVLE